MLLKTIESYNPLNSQEKYDKEAMLQFLNRNTDALKRENLAGHFTSSAIIVNTTFDKVLFIHHNIYNSWGWTGGHNDGDENSLRVAVREAKEETGLSHLSVYEDVLGLDTVYVQNHIRRGEFVGDHIHFNLTYLVVADESLEVSAKLDENSDVRWFSLDEVLDYVVEPRMIPIYKKLFNSISRVSKGNKLDY